MKKPKRCLLAGLFVLHAILPPRLQAQAPSPERPLEETIGAAHTRSVEPAVAELVRRAEAGDPAAQIMLAKAYLTSDVIPENTEIALRYLRAASDSGAPLADLLLGDAFAEGLGTEVDLREAFVWYDRAVQRSGTRGLLASAKRKRNAVAEAEGISIPTRIVPMKGSGLFAFAGGRVVEYDPVLSDFDPALQDASARVEVVDFRSDKRPRILYADVSRRQSGNGEPASPATINVIVVNEWRAAGYGRLGALRTAGRRGVSSVRRPGRDEALRRHSPTRMGYEIQRNSRAAAAPSGQAASRHVAAKSRWTRQSSGTLRAGGSSGSRLDRISRPSLRARP